MAQDPSLPPEQDLGLAGAMEAPPDFSAPPPANPQEFEERKSQWRDVLGQIQSDPNMMRSIAVMGIRLMQPGATFGEGVGAGFGAYEAGRGAQQEYERQAQIDAQNAALKDVQLRQAEQTLGQGAAKHKLDIAKLQADVDAIPDEAKRKRAQAELETFRAAREVDMYPLEYQTKLQTLQNLIATGKMTQEHGDYFARGGSAAGKKPAAEVEAEKYKEELGMYKDVVRQEAEAAGKPMSEAQIFVEAQRRYNASRYGQPTTLKSESTDAAYDKKARLIYNAARDAQGTAVWTMMSGDEKALWERGRELAAGSGGAGGKPNDTGTQPIGEKGPQKTVIVRNPETGKLEIQKVK